MLRPAGAGRLAPKGAAPESLDKRRDKSMKRKRTMDKFRHRKIKAAEDFKAQLEDAWHLIEKRKRLGRKELIIKPEIEEDSGN
jgi:hypothetical protein